MKYLNLDLKFARGNGLYSVTVAGPGRDPDTVDFVPPLSGLELAEFRRRLPGASVDPLATGPGGWANDLVASKDVGARLFKAAFHDRSKEQLVLALDAAKRADSGLRLRLHLGAAPELARLPWEYLYDDAPDRMEFLALFQNTPVVRYLELGGQSWRSMPPTTTLRVLVLIPKPSDLAALGLADLAVDTEWDNIRAALSDLDLEGRVILEPLATATPAAIRQRLRQDEFHVLHYVGHGFTRSEAPDGEILLVNEAGKGARISGDELSTLLGNFDSLRLVVLNSCLGAHADITDAFAGSAQQLVKVGMPAVLAMQAAISDPAAIACTSEFYRALADGLPVDAAVSNARQAIRQSREAHELEWGTPALYLRAEDGQIWNVTPPSEDERRQKRVQTLRRAARAAEGRRDMETAIKHWSELAVVAEHQPAGKEAADRVRELREAEELYLKGLEHFKAGDWQQAHDCFRGQLNRRGGRDGNVLTLLEQTLRHLREEGPKPAGSFEAHIKKIVSELAERQVVIFLGSEVNRAGRTDLSRWSKGTDLPTARELADYLVGVAERAYPRTDEHDLVKVAQWVDAFGQRGAVYDTIRDQLEVDYPGTTLHHVLAARLPLLASPDASEDPLTFVTATFDSGLEFALDRADEPFEVISYRLGGNGSRPIFEHWASETDAPTPIDDPTRYVDLPANPRVRVLLVKIHGGFERRGGRSFAVTEDDYLEYSRHVSHLLPKGLTDLLRDKYFLFIGYSLQDWHLRVFLHALKDDVWRPNDPRGMPAWAVQSEPSDLDRRLWDRWGVGLVEVPIDEYVSALRTEVETRLTSAKTS